MDFKYYIPHTPLIQFAGTICKKEDLSMHIGAIADCMQSHRKPAQMAEALWNSLIMNPTGKGGFSTALPHLIRIIPQQPEFQHSDISKRLACNPYCITDSKGHEIWKLKVNKDHTYKEGLYTGMLTLKLSHPREILGPDENNNRNHTYTAEISLENLQLVTQ